MKKRLSSLFIALTMLLSLIPCTASADNLIKESILGSWYGQYVGHSGDVAVNRYMDMTVEKCDDDGNISGEAYITTVEGQGYDNQWVKYRFTGKINFATKDFHMQGTKKISGDSTSNWTLIPFDGKITYNEGGEMYVSGIADNTEDKPFSFGHVSDWAKSEITEANTYNLIPATMKNKDLSKPVTRAEFAAVSAQLYEILSGAEVEPVDTPFTDIADNADKTAIEKAYGLNITVGVSDTEFDPLSPINREQLATMLCRTIKKYKFEDWTFATDSEYYLDSEGVKIYDDDNNISDYAKPSVYYMRKMGVINGIGENTFAPKNITAEEEASGYATATREQALVLALRIYKLSDLWK